MSKIFKYKIIPNDDYIDIEMPSMAQLLTVQVQRGEPYLWAMVDTSFPMQTRRFRLAGTGHPITEKSCDLAYIGTFQLHGGALIFHLFEVTVIDPRLSRSTATA